MYALEDLITDLHESKRVAEDEARKAQRLRREADELKEKIEEQKQTLEQRRQKLLDEARREAKRIILDAKDESAKVIKELNELKKSVQSENFGKTIEEARSKLRAKESGIDESFSGTIKPKNAAECAKGSQKRRQGRNRLTGADWRGHQAAGCGRQCVGTGGAAQN